jgi:hypothetical protein
MSAWCRHADVSWLFLGHHAFVVAANPLIRERFGVIHKDADLAPGVHPDPTVNHGNKF